MSAGGEPAGAGTRERDASAARIAEEIAIGFAALADLGPAVALFGSARSDPAGRAHAAARAIAHELGHAGLAVITGGGGGAMEAANRGAREAGARSVGLTMGETANAHLDVNLSFSHFFVRKLMFARFACAFVVLPGGFGTLDELFDALALIQTRRVDEFPVILCERRYWSGLVAWLAETPLARGAIGADDLALLSLVDEPAEVRAIAVHAARRWASPRNAP